MVAEKLRGELSSASCEDTIAIAKRPRPKNRGNMEIELEAKLTSRTLQPRTVSPIPKLSHPQGSMSRQLPQVWRTTRPGKSRRTCPKQLLSAFRSLQRKQREGKMRMVGVSAIAGFVLLVGSAGRIPPEETWCWETRLRQCYPAVLPAITVAHSEVMIGKPRDPYPGTVLRRKQSGSRPGSRRRSPYPLGYISPVPLWDRNIVGSGIPSNGRDGPRTPYSLQTCSATDSCTDIPPD